MLVLGLALLLATLSVAAFPCWSYSQRWGYVPTGITAILLFFVALVAVGGKPASSTPSETRIATPPATVSSAAAPTATPAEQTAFREPYLAASDEPTA